MASVALCSFALCASLFQLTSCKKAVAQTAGCPTPTYPISGLWIGTYNTDQVSHVPTYFSMTIYPDKSLIVKARGVPPAQSVVYATGSWTMVGDTLKYTDTTINYPTQVIQKGTMIYSNTGVLSNCKWQDVTGQVYTGTFSSLLRVN